MRLPLVSRFGEPGFNMALQVQQVAMGESAPLIARSPSVPELYVSGYVDCASCEGSGDSLMAGESNSDVDTVRKGLGSTD